MSKSAATWSFILGFCVACCGTLRADQPAAGDEAPVIRLEFDPAPEPSPALKYQFPPDYLKQVTGDAAQFYYRAGLMKESMPKEVEQEYAENQEKWMAGPLDKKTKDEMRRWVDKHGQVIEELRRAFVRTHCNWQLGMRELRGPEVISLLLPEAQQLRAIARMLDVKARIEIDDRRYDDALETLRLGYKLAEDEARQPTLINSLVGLAIVGIFDERLEQWMASPEAPNLYWAIASLPRPVVDMRTALRQEMAFPAQMFPFLNDPEGTERSVEGWRQVWMETAQELVSLSNSSFSLDQRGWQIEAGVTALMLKAYPLAKRELIEAGYDRRDVEAMPVGQVVAIQQSRVYRIAYHEMFKWSLLPLHEASVNLDKVNEKLRRMGYLQGGIASGKEMFPIVSLLLPAVDAAIKAPLRVERQLAALRSIEAIRMFAASHNGRLPQSLELIKQVPVPNDPLDGKPFRYESNGKTALLYLPPPPGREARHLEKRISCRPVASSTLTHDT